MGQFDAQKKCLVSTARKLTAKGYLMATGGNLSLRILSQPLFAVTPSNYDYLRMQAEDICVLDFDLRVVEGFRKPSVESAMHAAVYRARGDVNAIVHTHQVYASALALIKASIPALFDEQVRFLGRSVELIPYAPSGTAKLAQVIARRVCSHNNAYLMQNHGALVFGQDAERAVHNVEILEKCALSYLLALCSGRKVTTLPFAVRQAIFARLRADQKRFEGGFLADSSE